MSQNKTGVKPTKAPEDELLHFNAVETLLPIVKIWNVPGLEQDEKKIRGFLSDLEGFDPFCASGVEIFDKDKMDRKEKSKRYPCELFMDDCGIQACVIMNTERGTPTVLIDSDDVYVNSYKIGNAISVNRDYILDGRKDVIKKALRMFLNGFRNKIRDDQVNCLVYAGQQSNTASNLKELAANFAMQGKTLTHIVVSPGVKEMMRKESSAGPMATYPKISEIGDDTIPTFTGVNEAYGIKVIALDEASIRYYGQGGKGLIKKHKVKKKFGFPMNFLRWLTHQPEVLVDEDIEYRREIIIGLDLSNNDVAKQPIRENLKAFDDISLHRSMKVGIYGWLDSGLAVLRGRNVQLAFFPIDFIG